MIGKTTNRVIVGICPIHPFPTHPFLSRLTSPNPQLKATDEDEGINGELTYDLPLGIAEDKFRIDARSGRLSTTGPLDREAKSIYTLTVYVSDGAYPSRYDSAIVKVKVLDRNDGAPR